MASIASKNLYELLGNDPELDPERATPQPPTRAVDKPVARSGKRDAGPQAPSEAAASRRGGRGGRTNETGSERAFRDRDAGSYNNRSRAPDDGLRQDRHPDRAPRGEYRGGRGRGGRGGRGGRRGSAGNGDRQDKTGLAEHPKQAAHGWGGETGDAELADEKAGEAIAKAEEAEGFDTSVPPPTNDVEEEAEPENKSKSYEDYLAEQAEKKLQLGGDLNVRKPNEGASKKFPEGKAFSRKEDEENYFAPSGGKAARFREKKEKVAVDMSDVDPRSYLAEERQAARGGRGRGRGDRGDRGDRSEGGGRGRGGFRGDRGGDRGRGGDRPRGEFRGGRGGGRGGGAAPPRADDNRAFPSLGGN